MGSTDLSSEKVDLCIVWCVEANLFKEMNEYSCTSGHTCEYGLTHQNTSESTLIRTHSHLDTGTCENYHLVKSSHTRTRLNAPKYWTNPITMQPSTHLASSVCTSICLWYVSNSPGHLWMHINTHKHTSGCIKMHTRLHRNAPKQTWLH